jgi:putative hemolysin
VRVFGGRPDADSLARIDAALAQEQAVVLFPAGAVARWAWGRVQEGRWRTGFWRYAQRHQAPVLPIHIGGRHSPWFYGLSLLHPGLGTAMLAREMFPARQQRLEIRIGQALPAPAPEQRDAAAAAQRLRHWVAALGRGKEAPSAAPHSLRHAPCLRRLREDVEALPAIGRTEDGKEIRAGLLDADSALLLEVARQRERAFRAVGEGTGLACDRDRYDAHYEHIVVWDREALAVAGAYRVAHAGQVLASRGLSALYTASLFEFDPALVARLGQAVELGRSFVAPEYWGTRSLEYLWYGIGAWLRQHPEVRYLFGPVSISAALPQAAREQLVAFYQTHYGSRESWARSRHPFVPTAAVPDFAALEVDTAQALLRENLRALGARIPTLYKQYTELSEPGGVRFLAFGVDPDFAGATDGLLWLDLSRLKPRKRERYLGHSACGGVTA